MSVTPSNARQRMIAAARRRPTERIAVRAARAFGGRQALLDVGGLDDAASPVIRDPAVIAAATCRSIRESGVDAAGLCSDVRWMTEAMGLRNPVGAATSPMNIDRATIESLEPFDPEASTGFVAEAIRLSRADLGPDLAIVGTCAGPSALASAILGGDAPLKALIARDAGLFAELLARIVEAAIPHLAMQVEAGADLLEIREGRCDALDHDTYARHVLPHLTRLLCVVKAIGAPVVLDTDHSGTSTDLFVSAGPDVLALDVDAEIAVAVSRWGASLAFQGSLPVSVLRQGATAAVAAVRELRERFRGAPGVILRLDADDASTTSVATLRAVVDALDTWGSAS